VLLRHFSSTHFKTWLPNRPSWKSLNQCSKVFYSYSKLAYSPHPDFREPTIEEFEDPALNQKYSALRRKWEDYSRQQKPSFSNEYLAAEFLHFAVKFASQKKKIEQTAAAWKNPRQCKLCYRLSGERKFCSLHDRVHNEAGHRRGRRMQSEYNKAYQSIRCRYNAEIAFSKWFPSACPTLATTHLNPDPVELLDALDDESRNQMIATLRQKEHQKMVVSPQLFQIFLLRAEAWAISEEKKKPGGARIGAGRPRKKAA